MCLATENFGVQTCNLFNKKLLLYLQEVSPTHRTRLIAVDSGAPDVFLLGYTAISVKSELGGQGPNMHRPGSDPSQAATRPSKSIPARLPPGHQNRRSGNFPVASGKAAWQAALPTPSSSGSTAVGSYAEELATPASDYKNCRSLSSARGPSSDSEHVLEVPPRPNPTRRWRLAVKHRE